MRKLLTSLLLSTRFLFSSEAETQLPSASTNEQIEEKTTRVSLKLGQSTTEIPVLSLPEEKRSEYINFLKSTGSAEEAISLIETTNQVIKDQTISAVDYLNFMKIIYRFNSSEDALTAISSVSLDMQNDPEQLATALNIHLSYFTLKFPGMNAIEIPVLDLTHEEKYAYLNFLNSKNPAAASAIIEAAKERMIGATISGNDFLKFMKIIDRFSTIERAQEAIRSVAIEAQNDPEQLASALGMNLACYNIKFSGMNAIEIPVPGLTPEETNAFKQFFSAKSSEDAAAIIEAAKERVIGTTISGSDFLKFMKIIDRFSTIERAQEVIRSVAAEPQNNPEQLASALGMNLGLPGIKFTGAGFIEFPVNGFNEKAKLYQEFFSFSHSDPLENFNRSYSTVELAKTNITEPTISAESFYKFLQLARKLENIEGIASEFLNIPKEEVQDNADRLALALTVSANENITNGCRAYFIEELKRNAYPLNIDTLELLTRGLGNDDSNVKEFAKRLKEETQSGTDQALLNEAFERLNIILD